MPETAVDSFGNGLGWLMKREWGRPAHWLDRPNCDIALSEMAVLLSNREGPRPSIPTLASGVLKVEVFPLISTNVKWSEQGEDIDKAAIAHRKALFDEDAPLKEDVHELRRKLEECAMSLDSIRKHVESTFGERFPKGRNRKR
jgi:hypothetical protein